MTNQDRINKYIKENCSNCVNRNKEDCAIRIFREGKIITTKCVYYEREHREEQQKKDVCIITAKKQKAIMKKL